MSLWGAGLGSSHPRASPGGAAGGCRAWAGAACSGDGTHSRETQAAVARQGNAHFSFKAQPERLQVSPALRQPSKAAVVGSRSNSLCRCWCSARQPRCFPSRRDHRLLQGSGGQEGPILPLTPQPRVQDLGNTFLVGIQKGSGGVCSRHRRRSLLERQGSSGIEGARFS